MTFERREIKSQRCNSTESVLSAATRDDHKKEGSNKQRALRGLSVSGSASTVYTELRVKKRKKTKTKGKEETKKKETEKETKK